MTGKEVKESYRLTFHPQERLSEINEWLYEYIDGLKVKAVFEFGCGVGRHLLRLRERGYQVFGMDINATAVFYARFINSLESVDVGDDLSLSDVPADAFDLVLTNSVLCHIENPPIQELARITRRHLIMVEAAVKPSDRFFLHKYPGKVVHEDHSNQDYLYRIHHFKKP